MPLDGGYYEAKGVGVWNCTVVVGFGEVCGRSVQNTAYDIEGHMRSAHPFKYHDDRCSDEELSLLWDWIDPDDPTVVVGDRGITSAMILLCRECFVMVSFTTIRPGNLAAGVV